MSVRGGPLEPLKLYKIFRNLLGRRLSGVLTLSRGRAVKRVRIFEGSLLRTASNLKRESMLAELREQGFVTAAETQDIERFREAHGLSIEAALIRMGLVDRGRIQQLEARLSRRRLLDTFSWHDGTFTFQESPVSPETGETPTDTVDMLLEAAARSTPAEAFDAFVGGYAGQVVTLTPWDEKHGARFDELFGSPNVRNLLGTPQTYPKLAEMVADPSVAARQVCALVLAGLGVFSAPPAGTAKATIAPRTPSTPAPNRPKSSPPPPVVTVRRGAPVTATPPMIAEPPPRRQTAKDPPSPRSASPRPAAARPARTQAEPPRAARPTRAPQRLPDKVKAVLAEADRIHGRLKKTTHYDLLGLERDASAEAIRACFRALARDYHADRFTRYGLADEIMRRIQQVFMAMNRAHEVLSDPDARREYDLALEMAAKGQRVVLQEGTDVGQLFQAEQLVKDGVVAIRNGSGQAAHKKFQQALDINAFDIVAQAGSAYAEYMLAKAGERAATDADAAKRVLERVVAENEGREEPFLYLGRVHRAEGDTDRAIDCFKRALAINERCTEAASELRHLQRRADGDSKRGLFGRKKS